MLCYDSAEQLPLIKDCTCIILAGGKSMRMGQDKAGMQLGNDTLLNHVIGNVQPHFEKLIISVRADQAHLSLPQLCDEGISYGPMTGIATALKQVDTTWIFAIACDMPFMSAEVINAMAEQCNHQQAVVPMVNGHLQPLAAFYAKTCLPLIQQQFEHKDHSLKTLIKKMDVTIMDEYALKSYDPALLSFFDLDTKEDAIRAESMLSS